MGFSWELQPRTTQPGLRTSGGPFQPDLLRCHQPQGRSLLILPFPSKHCWEGQAAGGFPTPTIAFGSAPGATNACPQPSRSHHHDDPILSIPIPGDLTAQMRLSKSL